MIRTSQFGGRIAGTALALVLLGGAANTMAVPVTFFGEDVITSGVFGPNSAQARSDFLSNLTGVGSEDFESFSLNQSAPLNLSFPGSGGTLGATLDGLGYIANSGPGRFPTSGNYFWEVSTGSFSIDFTSPVSAFGFNGIDIGDFVTSQMVLDLTTAAGDTFSLTVPHSLGIGNNDNATLFFGFYDLEQTYTSLSFNNAGGGDYFAFDDMVIGDAGQITPDPIAVPEPATLTLLAIGLLGLGAKRRLSSKRS